MNTFTQFRVYGSKDGKCHYTTGVDNGIPSVLVSHNGIEKFRSVLSPEVREVVGQPLIQFASGYRDKNNRMIYEGDVIYFHKFNWLGVVVQKKTLVDRTHDDTITFWLQMRDGLSSLIGSNLVGDILFHSGLNDYAKIQQFLLFSDSILARHLK